MQTGVDTMSLLGRWLLLETGLEDLWGYEVTGDLEGLQSPGPASVVSCRQASAHSSEY